MTKEAASLSERSRWVTLAGLCLVCIVLGQLCDSYISTHKSAKSIFLLVYSFHMPAAMLLAGMASREAIRERRYSTVLSVFLLCLLTKILIFVFSSLLGKEASFSLIRDSGLSSYAMALGFCMLATFFLKRFDPRGVMACAIILACFAGYDNSLGDTLALSRTVVLFPFFFAGYALDMERLSKTLSRNAVRIGAAVVLVLFLLLIYRFGTKLYWLRPLLTGRNPFGSLKKNAGYGWLLRFFYYPITFCLIFAFLSIIPKRGLPVLNGIGKRLPSAFALCYCVIYLLLDGFGLQEVIGRLNGILFYLALLVISVLIAWLCAIAPLDKAVRRLITPQIMGKAGEQNSEASLSCFHRFETKQLLPLLAVTVFLSFTFALYGPLTLFLGNAEDLWFSLKDVFYIVVPMFVLLSAVLVLIAWILPQKARGIYIRLLFGIALAIYVQGTFININYGVLDGRDIDWSQYTGYAIWSTAVWAVCIALPFLLDRIPKVKKNTGRILAVAAAFLLIIQIPAMAVDLLHYKPKQGGEITVTTEGIYELSAKDNLIMILFDSMDEQYFQSFLDAHPDYAANLDGFVHYDNTLSTGARTIIAMPSIMTGVPYTRQSPYSEYIESIWTDETPFAAMAKAGYDVRTFTESMFFGEKAADYVRNLDRANQRVGSYSTLGQKLYKLDAFRFAPHLLKQQFWMDTEEFNEAIAQDESKGTYTLNDAKFFRDYLKNDGFSLNNSYDKAFRLYHLVGPHSPYKLSSDGLDNSQNTSLEEQLEGNFALLNAILQDLKEKGLYDSSTIIASADHGNKNQATHQMFLYKAPNASGALTTSHAPVSMFDMYTMFYQAAGQEAPDNPYSMDFTTLSENGTRERHAFKNTSDNASRPIIREYVTTASAIEADKMTIVAEHTGGVNSADTPYELGTKLSFASEATGNAYAVDGFGLNSGFNTLLRGPYAKLVIPIVNRPKQGELSVNMVFTSYQMHETGVKIYANGKLVADTELTKENVVINFSFNAEDVFEDDDLLTLEFEFDAVPSSERELPLLQRTFHSAVKSLTISLVP